MMHLMKLITLLALLIPLAVQADIVLHIGTLTVTAPDDYRQIAKRGKDTAVGEIVTKSGTTIEYDIGRLAGSPEGLEKMDKDQLANVLYFESGPVNARNGYIFVFRIPSDPPNPPTYEVELALGEGVGAFRIEVSDPSKLREARRAIAALKVK